MTPSENPAGVLRPRPFFIVGCPRSGTTLLRDLLRSHPRLTVPPESHFIPGFYRAFGDPSSDAEAFQIASRIARYARIGFWRLAPEPRDVAGCRSFGEVARRLFEMWAKAQDKPRWGDKTPHYVREIPLLMRLFPDAQVIHIIRDGRDAALSWLRTRFEPQNLYMAARMWKEMVTMGRRDGAALPADAGLELRYEALLAQPEATMRQVCDFLGEPFVADVLRPSRVWKRHHPGLTRLSVRDEIVPENAGKWKEIMSPQQQALFESVAGDLLGELGYPVEGYGKPLSRAAELLFAADHHVRRLVRIPVKLTRRQRRHAAVARVGNALRRLTRRWMSTG